MESSSLKKQHRKAFKNLNDVAAKNLDRAPRPFVLYDLRHTFLTRLGESGCDAWTLARIAGHSNVSMSSRYVHPSEDSVLAAMAKLGRHKSGHKGNSRELKGFAPPQLSQQKQKRKVVDVTGFEPATPCLQNTFGLSRKSHIFTQSIHTSSFDHHRLMCVVVRKCGRLYVGSLQKSLQSFATTAGALL
jgi:hypothetical protein